MVSSYALPLAAGADNRDRAHIHQHARSHSQQPVLTQQQHHHHHHHSHSHSHSHSRAFSGNTFSSPVAPSSFSAARANGSFSFPSSGLASSNGDLFTHAEVISREPSPLPAHTNGHVHSAEGWPSSNAHSHQHPHTHDPPHTATSMKGGRLRGESDLGRPAGYIGDAALSSTSMASGVVTGVLLSVSCVLASVAYSLGSDVVLDNDTFPPLSAYVRAPATTTATTTLYTQSDPPSQIPALIETCTMTSAVLLLVGVLAKIRVSQGLRQKGQLRKENGANTSLRATWREMLLSMLAVALPIYASIQLGGTRVGSFMMLAATTTEVSSSLSAIKTRFASLLVMLLCLVADLSRLTLSANKREIALGYTALMVSVYLLPPPLAGVALPGSSRPRINHVLSPLIASDAHINRTLLSGGCLSAATVVISVIYATSAPTTPTAIAMSTICIASWAATIHFAEPRALQSRPVVGGAVGCTVVAACAFLFAPDVWPGASSNGGLAALVFVSILYESSLKQRQHLQHDHAHNHSHDHHSHDHKHAEQGYSPFTRFIISRCQPNSLLHGILSEKDSRRIAYFTTLNFGFMLVQGVYGYLSGSLGLLSDTVHMFFDCLGLVIGLAAAVASKWPISPHMPYGWGKLNTLAGFGNGIFLMLVSIEFVWEAIEGIVEARELRHVEELLVVSVLGFLVNMVGLFAFGHAHAGHDHGHGHGGHSHSHSHAHSHTASHSHSHSHHAHTHNPSNGHAHDASCSHSHDHDHKGHAAGHAHDHHNDNMHGIFLHVAADAGGSLAVIISTALTLWQPWYLWDPLATIIIAILIFAMAVPLVASSGQKLLLVIPDETEYAIKNALQALGELRGVVGYTVPRFWLDDHDVANDSHGAHGHDHHDHHDHHSHDTHAHSHDEASNPSVLGTIHVIAESGTDLEDVRERVDALFRQRGMALVIQVEPENGAPCWCRVIPFSGSTPRVPAVGIDLASKKN